MSKLDDQLKELKERKLKVEFFKLFKKTVGNIPAGEFKSVEKEIKDKLFAFIDSQIDMIESGEVTKTTEIEGAFSSEEFAVLKIFANKAMNKEASPKTPASPPSVVESKQDKISFALAHRHLGGKKVETPQGTGGKDAMDR